jgi:predicted dehydrogenase
LSTTRFRTAVIGVGGIGSLHALTVKQFELAELVAVCDVSLDRARQVASDLGVPYFLSVEELLAHQTIDSAIIAVPDSMHESVTATVLRAHVPVMLEKPIAGSTEAAMRLAEVAHQTGVPLFIGHTLRFDPRYVAAYDAVRAGKIGEPIHFAAGRFTLRSRRELVRNTSSAPFDLGIHDIDAVQWVTGKRIVRVHAFAAKADDGGPPSCVIANCVLDGEAVGQLYCGWTRLDTWPNAVDSRFEIGGTEGTVAVRVYDDGGMVATAKEYRLVDALNARLVRGSVGGNLFDTVRHFYSCLASSTPFTVTLNDAISAVAVADAVNRSVASGSTEEVNNPLPI